MSRVQCCDNETRRQTTAAHAHINGIDFVNVDYELRRIRVYLFKPQTLDLPSITVVDDENPDLALTLINRTQHRHIIQLEYVTTAAGPHEGHTYRLSLRDKRGNPLPELDPRLCDTSFTSNETIASEVDFLRREPPPESSVAADIRYLAKDYASFRRLLLDRLALTMPAWQETHAADLGMTLVELLAFVGDQLSYRQDAVGSEAYLGTARRRQSIRRHARLVDYHMHEGCNARTFLQINVSGSGPRTPQIQPEDVFFTTAIPESYQIPGRIHQEFQLPPEVYQDIVCYEPLVATRDWRLTEADIKNPFAVIMLASALQRVLAQACDRRLDVKQLAKEFRKRIECRKLYSKDWSHSTGWHQRAAQAIDQINRILEHEEITGNDDERVRSRPLRFRNRALLDATAGDYLSVARIDRRIQLSEHLNEIPLYTWGESRCSLPRGATQATLQDDIKNYRRHLASLSAGDFLLFEEILGPNTGEPADADPTHRQVVRLTRALHSFDPIDNTPIVEVEWADEDRLAFPLCISSQTQPGHGCRRQDGISVARGNLTPISHGRRKAYQAIGVRQSRLVQSACGDDWEDILLEERSSRLQPEIAGADLTYEHLCNKTASSLLVGKAHHALPKIDVIGIPGLFNGEESRAIPFAPSDLNLTPAAFKTKWLSLSLEARQLLQDELGAVTAAELSALNFETKAADVRRLVEQLRSALTWEPKNDLLNSRRRDRHFVIENDDRRTAHLRFGDGEHGRLPLPGTTFYASYRTGNGERGNVGALSILHAVFRQNAEPSVVEVSNPLAAVGGQEPESLRETVLHAPQQWLVDQPRAILQEDYERLVQKQFAHYVQAAKASIHWVGAYYLVEVVIDRLSTAGPAPWLMEEVEKFLNQRRRIAHRVRVVEGQKVPIGLGLTIWLVNGHRAEDVRAEVAARFSNRRLANGDKGFFNPDRLTFGQPIDGSQIIRESRNVRGVCDVRIDFLQRVETMPKDLPRPGTMQRCQSPGEAFQNYLVAIGDLEIAQLDNDGGRNTGFLCLNIGATS